MIDSHCHLTAKDFDDDRDDVIARALAAGLTTLITISDDMSDLAKCLALAEKYEQIYYTVGVHPHHAADVDLVRDLAILREAAQHQKCVAIGEIGLDYHYMQSPKDTQQRVFETQLVLAKELNLPAVVHCRSALNQSHGSPLRQGYEGQAGTGQAVEDIWTIVNHVKPTKLVIHCCTEKWDDVARFVDAGYMLSFTGIVTYPKSGDVRETVRKCPLNRLMIETDAPYLSPIPHRGKRCEPAFVLETAKAIAEIKGISFEELDRVMTESTIEFFGLRS